MSLSCSCDYEYDFEPGQWTYWFELNSFDFEPLDTTRRKRCCSCNKLIDIGSLCIKYGRSRYPYNEVESRIVGTDWECFEEPPIPIADHYHCEGCGEIYLNLVDIGYECLMPNEDMEDTLKEYQALIGFKRNNDGIPKNTQRKT